jgi:hypothetical protein
MIALHGFVGKDGKTVEIGQKVRVYRNLNKPTFFSIQDAKTKLVLGYAPSVTIAAVEFVVSEASRQRVLNKKVRNVHACAIGMLVSTGESIPEHARSGYYNPYKTALFIDEETGQSIHQSEIAHCQGSKVYFK